MIECGFLHCLYLLITNDDCMFPIHEQTWNPSNFTWLSFHFRTPATLRYDLIHMCDTLLNSCKNFFSIPLFPYQTWHRYYSHIFHLLSTCIVRQQYIFFYLFTGVCWVLFHNALPSWHRYKQTLESVFISSIKSSAMLLWCYSHRDFFLNSGVYKL